MKHIFKAKTNEGHTIKILTELLLHIVKTACFTITPEGLNLAMMDTQQKILVKVELSQKNFSIYKFRGEQKSIQVGLNVAHLHKMLRTIKKKDSIKFKRFNKNDSLE